MEYWPIRASVHPTSTRYAGRCFLADGWEDEFLALRWSRSGVDDLTFDDARERACGRECGPGERREIEGELCLQT